ncbi:NADPH:quinone reductase-like Zn-dependent oxidoreductase [Saccharothrix coeruleofusca]|uniref:NADP-dependent oxidoreductase n=1 Tax=Saccharothrix coeruleofusca TaxID=33919 RepID=UPI001AE5F52B|nr:NADP-dependent oxidoreductase [Saccharothrix coeruleofusca]MBP2338986.1 NADPH:quinone reductase-like Zn-dependent oxidoreductase [Saccharothrix coeruleofusca]
MRAVVVRRYGGPEVLEVVETTLPHPGPGEVRIKVGAAAVNFADVLIRTGLNVQYGAAVGRARHGVGCDVAGTVDALGEGVDRFAVGQAVIGLQERLDLPLGAYAEYAVLEEWALAPAPAGATAVEAATLPLNATTADQALDALGLRRGQRLLVTGAAGAVGGFATELARLRGLRVLAQAGAADEPLVRSFGAESFVDRDDDLTARVRALVPGGVDGVIDAANVGTAALDAVAHGGGYVSLLNSSPFARRAVRTVDLAYHTDGKRLWELSALAGAGMLTLRVADTLPLERAAEAHERLAAGGLRGRLVLVP